jgi:uncharacterized membrane protein
VHWLSSADPTRGALTRRLGLAGTAALYVALAAIMGLCASRMPEFARDLVAAILSFIFIDFLGWLNGRLSRDENTIRRNRAWLMVLAVILLAALVMMVAMQLTLPPADRAWRMNPGEARHE